MPDAVPRVRRPPTAGLAARMNSFQNGSASQELTGASEAAEVVRRAKAETAAPASAAANSDPSTSNASDTPPAKDYIADPRMAKVGFGKIKEFLVASGMIELQKISQAGSKFALVHLAEQMGVPLEALLEAAESGAASGVTANSSAPKPLNSARSRGAPKASPKRKPSATAAAAATAATVQAAVDGEVERPKRKPSVPAAAEDGEVERLRAEVARLRTELSARDAGGTTEAGTGPPAGAPSAASATDSPESAAAGAEKSTATKSTATDFPAALPTILGKEQEEKDWSLSEWVGSLKLGRVLVAALAPPPGQSALEFARTGLVGELRQRLKEAKVEGLAAPIREGVVALCKATGTHLPHGLAADGSEKVALETFDQIAQQRQQVVIDMADQMAFTGRTRVDKSAGWGDLRAIEGGVEAVERYIAAFRDLPAQRAPHFFVDDDQFGAAVLEVVASSRTLGGWPTGLEGLLKRQKKKRIKDLIVPTGTRERVERENLYFQLASKGTLTSDEMHGVIAVAWVKTTLTSVDLSTHKLSPELLGLLARSLPPHLTTLSLDGCDIADKGADLTGLQGLATALEDPRCKLRGVTLADNRLGAAGGAAIATGLKANTSLTECNLRGNPLGTDGWCAVFGALRDNVQCQLVRWDLSGQALSAQSIGTLMEYLSASRTLTEATLLKNEMDDETAASLATLSKQKKISLCGVAPEMSAADFSRTALKSTDCVLIAAALDFRPALLSIDVSHNEIGQAASLELLAAIKARELVRLNMAACNLGVEGAHAIAQLPSFCKSMTECDLRSNQLGDGWTTVFDALAAKKGNKIASWDLRDEKLSPAAVKSLAAHVSSSHAITSVDLGGNDIGPEGGKVFATAIAECSSFRNSLNLADNNLANFGNDMSGIKAIAKALKTSSVTSVNLSGNFGGPEFGQAVADALAVNCLLKDCDLRGNRLDTDGWCAVFDALQRNAQNRITTWELGQQGINSEIAKSLAAYMAKSKSLTLLDLSDNNLGREAGSAMAEGVGKSISLERLNLTNNNFDDDTRAAIEAVRGSALRELIFKKEKK